MTNTTIKVPTSALVAIGLMLFALFFGAGNLIFPAGMGQLAGNHLTPAMLGFIFTGVGLPLLGVLAIGYSGCKDVQELGARFHPVYGIIFAVLLYLTIGPFFAMPRTATVSFAIGIEPFLNKGSDHSIELMMFSVVFFVVCWWLSLNPGKLVDRVGKVLTPMLLLSIGILVVATIINPMGVPQAAQGKYVDEPFVTGFLEGYQTMDALASLVFAIIVINAVRAMGITDKKAITMSTFKAGLVASLFLALVYVFVAKMGVYSVEKIGVQSNGAPVLAATANFYFDKVGNGLLAVIILLACVTTSVGLITACAEYFHRLLPKISFKAFATGLAIFAAFVANKGLDQIISLAVPVLMFLYPLTVVIIALAFLNNLFQGRQEVYATTLSFTLIVSLFDGLSAAGQLGDGVKATLSNILPGYALGMGWLVPAIIGFVIGFIWTKLTPKS